MKKNKMTVFAGVEKPMVFKFKKFVFFGLCFLKVLI